MNSTKLILSLAAATLLASSLASAQAAGRRWALLIGVSQYEDNAIQNLPFVVADVRSLRETLVDYGDYEPRRIVTIGDDTATRGNLMQLTDNFLQGVRSNDHLMVYFSGHGIRDEQGNLYLVPRDCRVNDLANTAVAADWLRRQLAASSAKSKVLVLDACHAGQGGSFAAASELKETFEDLESVVVLASSSRSERSNPWRNNEDERSLFSYWLTQGLKGNADADSDGQVDFYELYGYVHDRVTWTAHMHLGRNQTPVCYYGPSVTEVPVLVGLRPKPIKQVIGEMAREVAFAIDRERLGRVATFPSFSNFSYNNLEFERFTNKDSAWLAKDMAEDFAGALLGTEGNKTVMSQEQARRWMRQWGGNDTKLVVTHGTMIHRGGPEVYLNAKAVETSTGRTIAEVGRTARIGLDELPTLDTSVQLTDALRTPVRDPNAPGQFLDEEASIVTNVLAQKSADLQPPQWPYSLEVLVDGRVREPYQVEGRTYVALDKGEVFHVRVNNTSGRRAFVKLMVDGVVTRDPPIRPEYQQLAGRNQQAIRAKGLNIQQISQHARFDKNWYEVYVLPRGGFTFKGYYSDRHHYDFLVADEHDALATKMGEVNSLGLISAAIYEEVPGSRGPGDGLGVTPGREREGGYYKLQTGGLGDLLGWSHVHYVSSESLAELRARQ